MGLARLLLLLLAILSGQNARAGGDVASCSEDDFLAALAGGGLVTFTQDCPGIVLSGTIVIQTNTVIDAQGHSVTISGGGQLLLFDVRPGVSDFTMRGLTIIGGLNTNGGAMYINTNATVTLTNCVFGGNMVTNVGGLTGTNGGNGGNTGDPGTSGTDGAPAYGGAIFNLGNLTALTSQFLTNSATGGNGGIGGDGGSGSFTGGNSGNGGNGGPAYGGAICSLGPVVLRDCTFQGNQVTGGNGAAAGTNGTAPYPGLPGNGGGGAQGLGAGLYSSQLITVANCTFAGNNGRGGNSADAGSRNNQNGNGGPWGGDSLGGGVCAAGGGMFTNCTFFTNTVTGGSGGNGGPGGFTGGNGGNGGSGLGGGLYSQGMTPVVNCTFVSCAAAGGTNGSPGSAPYPGNAGQPGTNGGGGVSGGSSTIQLMNSLLATNLVGNNAYGSVTDGGYNLSTDGTLLVGPTSRTNLDARIGTLANNGGPTMTIALLTNSPAIDAAGTNTALFPPTDQRGISRPQGASKAADIGAYEAVTLPVVLTPPMSQATNLGATVSFTPTVLGDKLTYRWRFSPFGPDTATNIPNANSVAYTISGVTITNAGYYVLFVSNRYGAVTSAPAILSLFPYITAQPTNQSVAVRGTVTFSAGVAGTAPLGFQWFFNQTNLISGASDSNYTISVAQLSDAGTYCLMASNSFGSVTSALATLTVIAPPSITSQPQNQSKSVGDTATFMVTAAGTAPLNYQWRFNGTPSIGNTSDTLSIGDIHPGDAGTYDVVVTNVYGAITSAPATLTVIQYSISGHVFNGATGLGGATVTAGDASAVSDASGAYSISNVAAGNFSVFATAPGYGFGSAQMVTIPPSLTGLNFYVSNRFYTLSGRVTAGGVGLSGVNVYGGQMTDSSGNYSLSLLQDTYVLAPTKNGSGYSFSPSNLTVNLSQDTSNVNFIAGLRITSITRNPNGTVTLSLYGPNGIAHIEASTNLRDWTPIVTNNAPFTFTDSNAPRFPLRYYRGVKP